jgi:chromate transport protein ChrA
MERLRRGGYGMFGVTMLLCLPAMLAVFVSAEISGTSYHSSALWFMYQVSQYIAVIGIIVAAALTVMKASDGKSSRIAVTLMGFSVLLSVFLLWYAVHIYRSPWF